MSRPVLPAEQAEQHERVVAGQPGGLAALSVVADGDGVPVGEQTLLDEARQCPLVLDDQDALSSTTLCAAGAGSDDKRLLNLSLPCS